MHDGELIVLRKRIVAARNRGEKVKDIARIFGISRWMVWKWWKRTRKRGGISYKSMSRAPKRRRHKLNQQIENQILALRASFRWGTGRIGQYLSSPPDYIRKFIEKVTEHDFICCNISRQAINRVLKRHNMNGSPYAAVRVWNRFTAVNPNDMWQIDLKGPCLLGSRRVYLLVVIDDHSRYLLLVQILEKADAHNVILSLERFLGSAIPPQMILSDNGGQFKDDFTAWCSGRGIKLEHGAPHHPETRGKVERGIRNINEEFLRLNPILENPESCLAEFVRWYNHDRVQMGICATPASLYFG